MFVLTNNVSASQKAIATLLAIAVVMWTFGYHATAQAANVTFVKDTISDSAPSVVADHEIVFVTPSGVATGTDIAITFDAAGSSFSGIAAITSADIDVLADGVNLPVADWSVVSGGDLITITLDSTSIAAGASTTVLIGLNAVNEGSPVNQIVNALPVGGNESFEIDISAGASDSGHTRIVILSNVLVTAQVLTTFDFTVYGNPAATDVNGTTTTQTSSTTTIPFGVLTAGDIKTISQDLTVGTNAANGFVVTVQTDGAFESSTGADIDVFVDGAISTTPAVWAAPNNDILDENDWGHWGVTSEDQDTDGARTNEFSASTWVGVDTTPVPVFGHDGPADEVTVGAGSTTVGYQVEISPLQEAGDDYNTTLTYIATPTF